MEALSNSLQTAHVVTTTAEPQKDESPGVITARAPNITKETTTEPIVPALPDDRKVVGTLRAKFALRGFQLWELSDGSLLASGFPGWPPKPLPDTHAALVFLRRLGGA